MEQIKNNDLPIAGRIQHGEQQVVNNKKRVVELGYFIAKIKDTNMDFLANRFNEQFLKKQAINIQFFNDTPLTIRRVRYNQSGAACYCLGNNAEGKIKESGKWKPNKCSENCNYRVSQKEGQKPQCNIEGILKFIMPSISTDRIWYMKITGQTSIGRLYTYINLQKKLGNSIIGNNFNLFLKEETQTNIVGKTFNNYILDIIQTDINLTSTMQSKELSTTTPKSVEKKSTKQTNTKTENKETKQENINNEITNISDIPANNSSNFDNEFNNCYMLVDTNTTTIETSDGTKEYLQANLVDMNDKEISVIINPKDADELHGYDVGTVLKLELITRQNRTFSNNITYIQKVKKNAVA